MKPYYEDSHLTVLNADVLDGLRTLADESVYCCVTSPPYWGLRDYGEPGQLGLEPTPEEYVARMVEVFREVRRVLRDDGSLWLNLGDSYAGSWKNQGRKDERGTQRPINGPMMQSFGGHPSPESNAGVVPPGLKPKDLVGIPWRVAFALQADGWYLRSDIIWHKPNPMPESVTDRPTKAHEYVFLLSKSARYFYDADAITEPAIHAGAVVKNDGGKNAQMGKYGATRGGFLKAEGVTVKADRNKRTVWTITTKPYAEAHFATFPPELPTLCIKAGCPEGGTVLDPFAGAGTTGWVAKEHGRKAVMVELNPDYCKVIAKRCAQGVLAL